MTFLTIIYQTCTFWTSILAFCVFGERMIPLELIAMVICFVCMITITFLGSKQADEDSDLGEALEGKTEEAATHTS